MDQPITSVNEDVDTTPIFTRKTCQFVQVTLFGNYTIVYNQNSAKQEQIRLLNTRIEEVCK